MWSKNEKKAAKTSTAVPSNLLSNLSEAASAASAAFLLNYVQQSGGMPDTNKASTSVSSRTKAEPLMSSHQQVDLAKSRALMNSAESNKQHHSSKTSFGGGGVENQREHSSSPAPSAKKLNSAAAKQQDSLQSMRYNSSASFYDMSQHNERK